MAIDVKQGEPFTLPDGTTIHPGSGEKGNANTITRKIDPIEESDEELAEDVFEGGLSFKRNLADLPAPQSRLNPLMLVLAYHMWGLDSTAIAMFLDLQEEQVEAVMCDDMFVAMRKDILEAIRYAEIGNIHGYLAQKSLRAARTVVKHMNSKDGDRSLAAAKDILDRSGFRPSDRVEHVHKFEDELRIVYVKEQTMPIINLNMKEITNGNGS